MENLEQSGQDVVAEVSSPSPESQTPITESADSQTPEVAQKEAPFHEHPRFKELINQRNEFSQRLQDYEKRFQDLNSRLEQQKPQAQTPESKLVERLKGIDPEFGSLQEQVLTKLAKLEQLEQWKTQQETQQRNSNLSNSLEKLHVENKVPNEVRDLYEARLWKMAQDNPQLTLSDLPNIYKQIHEKFSKYEESRNRSALSSYSTGKSKDSAIPASLKGAAPKANKAKVEFSKDPAEARAQIVKNALNSLKDS